MANKSYIICIGDIHGCFKTLMALVDKINAQCPDGQVVLLGDLIDRGADSKSVVEWVIKNKIPCVKGNHEELCHYDYSLWKANGGRNTIKSWHGHVPREIKAYLAQLPHHIIHEDFPELLISHTGHGLNTSVDFIHDGQTHYKDPLWSRSTNFPNDGLFRVFGHTVVVNPVITDTYAAIDTGCAYGGKLTAFVWPTKEIIQQENIDD